MLVVDNWTSKYDLSLFLMVERFLEIHEEISKWVNLERRQYVEDVPCYGDHVVWTLSCIDLVILAPKELTTLANFLFLMECTNSTRLKYVWSACPSLSCF